MSLIDRVGEYVSRETKEMPIMGLLTREEWLAVGLPLYTCSVEYKSWIPVHYEMATKWAVAHSESWVYVMNKTFVFGNETDRTLFLIWLGENCLNDQIGNVV